MADNILCFDSLKTQCKERGMDPSGLPAFQQYLNKEQLQARRLRYREMLQVVTHFLRKFHLSVKGVPILTVISDEKGYLLQMMGDESIKNMVNELGIQEGIRFTEEDSGINSISLTLKHKTEVQIIGEQHYHRFLHSSACYAVPIKDQTEDKVIGTISLMTSIDFANPLLLTLLSTVNDSIERELKLLKQNQQLNVLNQIIMDTTRNGIIIANPDGKLIGYNIYAEHLTGIERASVFNQSINELKPFGMYLEDVLREKKLYTDIEISFTRKDGHILTFLFDALPIFDDGQHLVGAFAQFRDITERKQTESLLLNSEKLAVVGQLAASVAHEIRNPLTTIRGFIQFTEENFSNHDYHKIILGELDRINFIISEFLILSKPHVLNYQKKNVLQTLNETIVLFQAQAIMNNIEVKTDLRDSELTVECDENQLKQVFMNLLKNSMEALPYGGTITVRAWKKGAESAVIEIEDDGCGMKQEHIENLGKPFYTTKETGTGLGYMVINRIMEHHKGSIRIKSKPDKGTTVNMTIPLSFE
ncbi:ATP-binding protein [Priestia abyssalis]|uniref:ATP-binding protein n=1 Tax=Priestia abyssalis TaxID=1221450 RepID=UPI000994BCAF|nr:ATP-binding protein [Priestia abyssalis]